MVSERLEASKVVAKVGILTTHRVVGRRGNGHVVCPSASGLMAGDIFLHLLYIVNMETLTWSK